MSIERLSVNVEVEHGERAVKTDMVLMLMPLPHCSLTFAVHKLETCFSLDIACLTNAEIAIQSCSRRAWEIDAVHFHSREAPTKTDLFYSSGAVKRCMYLMPRQIFCRIENVILNPAKSLRQAISSLCSWYRKDTLTTLSSDICSTLCDATQSGKRRLVHC